MENNLIAALQSAQERDGYLTREAMNDAAEKFGVTAAKVLGVATFYSQFRLRPVGRNTISVCVGTACHVNGAAGVLAALRDELGLKDGENTTDDGAFTVADVACLGCCSLAPVMTVNGTVYGSLTAESARKIISEMKVEA